MLLCPVPIVDVISEIEHRPGEIVFVTLDEAAATVLRDWGLLAMVRPEGGFLTLREAWPLEGRDVALVVTEQFGADGEWAYRDMAYLNGHGVRSAVYVPHLFRAAITPDSLGELVAIYAGEGKDSTQFVEDAQMALDGPRAVEPVREEEIVDRYPRIDPAAFHGIAGKIVAMVDPHTEADPIATLVQFLAAFGNMIGRTAFFSVSATRHYTNLFIALVGQTASGRKGTSWDLVRWIFGSIEPEWENDRIQGGLVSGEGLVHHVRDRVMKREPLKDKNGRVLAYQSVEADSGVEDKRLMVVESELARMLKAMNREANTLSDVTKQAWDSGNLRTMGKGNPAKATGAHISIVGHVTRADIIQHLTQTDSANGFGNRFLWVAVRRSKFLPDGGEIESVNWEPIRAQIRVASEFARGVGKMTRDPEAREMWGTEYPTLSAGKPGLLGAILGRAEPQVMRLACLYALLHTSRVVKVEHLQAALALWRYCEASAALVFGDTLGDPDAERLLEALRKAEGGMTRTDISKVFGRHKDRRAIVTLLSRLLTDGLIHRQREASTGGRRPERWFPGKGVETCEG